MEMKANMELVDRPKHSYKDCRKQMPTDTIRLKLINKFEQPDTCFRFTEMRQTINSDPDIKAWWIHWVHATDFVWRFLFAYDKDLTEDGRWLRESHKAAVGDKLYEEKLQETRDSCEAAGETIHEFVYIPDEEEEEMHDF